MRELGIIEDGAVLIEDGVIVAVGTSAEVVAQADQSAERIDARGQVVLPGFVDAHTHPVFAGTRVQEYELRAMGLTYQEIAARGGGIRSTMEMTRAASEDELLSRARRYARWFIEHGTTTIEAKSGYGLSLESEIKLLRVMAALNREGPLEIVPTLLAAHIVPPEFQHQREAYLSMISDELLPLVAQEKLAEYHDVFCETGAFSVDETRALMLRARELGLKLRLHANQFSDTGAAALAAELNMSTCDHLEHVDQSAIAALQRAGVIAVLLPGAVWHLGSQHYPPARAMIDAGLAVVLATDFNPGSSPTPNMQMILSLACTQMGMTPAEALTATTLNAAYSLNRGDRIGSIEIGKQADLVIFDCADYREIPYFYGRNHVNRVIKRGCVVFTKSCVSLN
ncbi:MAG: imidazolonepropionase [Acidobacteriota bacterium]|nr:imidazolonepropionase [Blastocatellia bacterium]MDW8240647.1 imidazolonepropionase [Acidobacteriota bacterium]